MRVIIVDDEITSSQVLEKLILQNLPELNIVAICSKPSDAIDKISSLKPELVFMDIEMPGMSGFDILEKLNGHPFDLIFTTAHSQYGIKAIQFSAIDYLLKPIEIEDLKYAVERVIEHQKHSNPLEKIKLLLENLKLSNSNNPFNRVALPTTDGLKFVYPKEITRCDSSNNYTMIYFQNGDKLLVCKTLKDIESLFSATNFCRVHNSHLVNVNYISKLIKGEQNAIVMNDNTEVEVSRRKKDELIKMLNL